MTLYARSDLMSVAVPVESGGCGQNHSRPVIKGAPAKVWALDCPAHCEPYLRGDSRPKLLRYETDKNTGRVLRQERVADRDPHWSSTADSAPLTPDEERTNAVRQERGAQQIQMIQALAALRASGVDIPPEAMWLLERELPAGVLRGTVVCANQHDAPAGSKHCPECGISMAARAAIGGSGEDEHEAAAPAVDLALLHPQTLKKMCRKAGLPDDGNKETLISRLAA